MAGASLKFLVALIACLGLVSPASAVIALKQPSWNELTVEQRSVLAPLSREWDTMEAHRKKKWLGIAQRFSSLTPDEKARVQQRMKEWAALSPQQRDAARDTYRAIQLAPPEQRDQIREAIKQQWDEYSALPENEKARLNAEAKQKSPGKPTGLRSGSSSIAVPLSSEPSR